jgi:NADH-quinone oxidoreductase subunit E
MAVRRLNPEQPADFAFTPANQSWARDTIAKYPEGKQASAIILLLWRAQEQEGWLPEPAIRNICDMLGMAHIRGMEIATFYTMFQLSPVGRKAHLQICGTTPCMLRGSRDLVAVCKSRINEEPHHLGADGAFSWEEVECIGVCANAPVVQVGKETYEDLTAEQLEKVLDGFAAGQPLKAGSQIGRTASSPVSGLTTLTDPSLYDGSTVGAWQKRFEETAQQGGEDSNESAPASALASPAHKNETAQGSTPNTGTNKQEPGDRK